MSKDIPRVKIEAYFDYGDDGKDARWRILYRCPYCNCEVWRGFKTETRFDVCIRCGSVFDYGEKPPVLETIVRAKWPDEEVENDTN